MGVRAERHGFLRALGVATSLTACGLFPSLHGLSDDYPPEGPPDGGAADASSVDASVVEPDGARPSCEGLASSCGLGAGTEGCCSSSVVEGGTFRRSYEPAGGGAFGDPSFNASVHDFRLDTYEATVGRFRTFAEHYPASRPAVGSGNNPNDAQDRGWDPSFDGSLPETQAALRAALGSTTACDGRPAWTDQPGANEELPMSCITWFEAFAFCIWDGGRLPTEAEWNYAAAGGNEQRIYPWSKPPSDATITQADAVYGGLTPAPVGSKPSGRGKWGQDDLAGNLWEWTVDGHASPYAITPCVDCAEFSATLDRVIRGGSFYEAPDQLHVSYRNVARPDHRGQNLGVRCTRPP